MKKLIIRIIVNAVAIINLMLIYKKILYDVIDNITYFHLFALPTILITVIILLMNKLINRFAYLNLTTNYCFLSITIATVITIIWWRTRPDPGGWFLSGLDNYFNEVFAYCMLILILIIWITTHFYKRKNM